MHALLKAAALAFGLAAAPAAQAALLDFTDPTSFTVSGDTITGSGFTSLVATGGNFNISEAGPGPTGALVGITDGLGIGDDEISFPREALTLTFASEVTLTALYLLDFFLGEEMTISNGTDTVTFLAVATDQIGFFNGGLGLAGTIFTFTPGSPDDNPRGGVGDFALGGLSFHKGILQVIPLPAGVLLLGAALGGLAILRRRRRITDA